MERAVTLLLQRDKFVLLPHIKIDGDALGSCLALCEGLRFLGKEAYVFPGEPISSRYDMIKKEEYLCDESYRPETVVAIDCGEQSLLGERGALFDGRVDLVVDHHLSHKPFAKISVVDAASAATGEIVYFLLRKMGATVNRYMAKCLYVAIVSDTGCFRYSNTTAVTHRIGAELYDIHGNFFPVNYDLFECRSMDQIKAEREVLETLEFYEEGRVALIVITDKMREVTNTTEEDTDYLSQIPRRIRGVEVGITLKENSKEGGWRVSLRTNGIVDASQVCGGLGGGGHVRASGARLEGSLDEVKKKVLEAVTCALRQAAQL